MRWFINLSTRAKLLSGVGVLLCFMCFIVWTAYQDIKRAQGVQEQIQVVEFANMSLLSEIRAQQFSIRARLLGALLQPIWNEQEKTKMDESAKRINSAMIELQKRNEEDRNFLDDLEQLQQKIMVFRNTRNEQIIPQLRQGQKAGAIKLATTIQQERFDEIERDIQSLVESADARAQKAVANSQNAASETLKTFVLMGTIALILGVLLALFLSNAIAKPLSHVTLMADRIADGDLTAQMAHIDRHDEVGILSDAFARMVKSLQEIMADISSASTVLGSAASEISASTTQLASSAGGTASAVSETTTTVEQIRQAAQVTNQKARKVAEAAQKAVQTSQEGCRATNETTAGMQRIQEQMETIAEGMMRLAEQSQAIGQIIASVDDLAQQSNLLAVNASIEAAKAGEQGKGFAVVASEVKSLADQSKQATMQVRAILTDIQKATSSAVLATEQGSKAVELGLAQSEQAGEAIMALSESVDEAAQAASQIAATSQQQLIGMDQVAQAMESIKLASNQNVGGARQLEEAAHNLTDLGHRLKGQVEKFKV